MLGLIIGWRDRRAILYDDVGITLRYALRIADGYGWTYNDGDRTNGASSPLYTMVLALCRLVGFDLVQSAKLIGVVLYAGVVGVATFLAQKIGGLAAGMVASVLILTSFGFRGEALSGMETVLAVFLGLLVILAIIQEKDSLAGVFLGLMLLNKLDAALLAMAVVAAWWVLRRVFPLKQLIITCGVVAPWLLFSWLYFGSPLPYTITQKISVGNGDLTPGWNIWWIFDRLRIEGSFALLFFGLLAILLVPYIARSSSRASVTVSLCVAWPILHFAAFSLVDMGETYPWYVGSLYAPLAVAASIAITFLCLGAISISRQFGYAGLLATALVVAGVGNAGWGGVGRAVAVVRQGHTVSSYEEFERTRLLAGEWLAKNASANEGILTCWGWVAYEAEQSPIAETCPLSTRKPVVPTWFVNSAFIGVGTPQIMPAPGWNEVVSFRSDGGVTTVYRVEVPSG